VKIHVKEYLLTDGTSPYKAWFDALDSQTAAKISVAISRLELGNTSNIKWFHGIGEYVLNWGPGYRVYLAKDGETLVILFGGGTKNKQQKDIDKAKKLHTEYKQRKKLK